MEITVKTIGGILLLLGIIAIIAVRAGARAERAMKDILNKNK